MILFIYVISNESSGNNYRAYYLNFWDKAGEYEYKGLFLDWCVLDTKALHAAIAQRGTKTFCENCPFHLK